MLLHSHRSQRAISTLIALALMGAVGAGCTSAPQGTDASYTRSPLAATITPVATRETTPSLPGFGVATLAVGMGIPVAGSTLLPLGQSQGLLRTGDGGTILVGPDGRALRTIQAGPSGSTATSGLGQTTRPLSCKILPVVGTDPLVAMLRFDTRPALGINPATYDAVIEFIGSDLKVRSEVFVAKNMTGSPDCVPASGQLAGGGNLPFRQSVDRWTMIAPSPDGKWVSLAQGPTAGFPDVILVSPTGEVRTVPQGRWVAGVGVLHSCAGAARNYCQGTWDDIGGPVVSLKSCFSGDANCSLTPTGNPNGSVLLKYSYGDDRFAGFEQSTGATRGTVLKLGPKESVQQFYSAYFEAASGMTVISFVKFTADGTDINYGTSARVVTSFSANGDALWTVPADDVCGVTSQGFIVVANGQIALIDAAGHQLAASSATSSCPEVTYSGLGLSAVNGQIQILSLRQP